MTNSSGLKEWELEPDIHTFEVTGESLVRFKSHHKKRIDKKWRKRYGYHLRDITVHCVVYRHPEMKHLCGYVGLPKHHLLHGVDYDKLDVQVHGGLTFSRYLKYLEGFKQDFWYFGFDAAHFMDLTPGLEEILARLPPLFPETDRFLSHNVYRNMAYMTNETKLLATQLLAGED